MAEDRDKQSAGTSRSLAGTSITVTYNGTPTGWFDPLKPMTAMAPESIKGRILDFPTGYNRNIRPKAYEPITFEQLRGFADSYDLLRLVIETRKDQVATLRWNIVAREHAKDKANDEALLARVDEIKKFFIRPDSTNFWDDWLRMILEDLFVLDAPAVFRRRTYGGDLYALEPIDGGTIKRVIDQWGRTPEPPEVAYQQVLKGFPALDYTTEDLIYRPRNKRTHKVYGYSPVEQIVMTINIGLRRQVWQLQSFTEGNIPEALIGTPSSWTPDQIRSFQDWFDAMLEGNTAQRSKARFVPGEVAKGFVSTKPDELFGAAEEWLARVVCYAFSVSPQALLKMMNRATAETAQETAQMEGLAPIMKWVKGFMDAILLDDFQEEDLEFAWVEEDELDPNVKSEIIEREQASGRLTMNEARKEQGRDPIDHPDADRPMLKTASGWVPIFKTPEEEAEAEAMRLQIAGQAAPGDEEGADGPGEVSPGADAPSGPPTPPGQGQEAPEGLGKLEKKSKTKHHPAGSSKGGQFASTGGGSSETEFGDSDAHEAIKNGEISENQQKAFDDYTHTGYERVNGSLRDGEINDKDKSIVKDIDDAISGSVVSSDTVVYRGVSDARGDKLEGMKGKEYSDGAYVSTSSNASVATAFTFSEGEVQSVLAIKIPKGNNALSLSKASKNNHEKEVLLPRGSRFKVTGVETVQYGRDTIRVIHVTHVNPGRG